MEELDGTPPELPEHGKDGLAQVTAWFHKLARSLMRRERVGHTLSTTDLVNEAVMRLLANGPMTAMEEAKLRRCFATECHHILCERGRKRGRRERNLRRTDYTDGKAPVHLDDHDALDFAACLEKLQRAEPRVAEVIKMSVYAGMDMAAIAATLGVELSTAYADRRLGIELLRECLNRS